MTRYTITRLGRQGDGIADGPIYAPLTLPDEIVTGDAEGNRLHNVRIESPSPDRVAAPCRHFRSCGGCQLQHGSDRFVADWKQDVVAQALAAHGLEAEYLPVSTSPPRSRRRATFAARRTKKGAMAGFHARASDVIVEVPECQLLHPDLMAALPVTEALALLGASRKNGVNVAATLSTGGLDLAVTGGKPLDGPLRAELAALAAAHGLARLAWEGDLIVTRHMPEQIFGTARVVPPSGSFLQATAEGQTALVNEVARITRGAKRIVDLFAGCGTFSLSLAAHAEVHAVEGAADMIAALDVGWRKTPGLKQLTHEVRDLFRRPLLAEDMSGFDAVVLDPPRAGAQAQTAELCRAGIATLAYVSCNPASFARDARELVAQGYRMGPIRVVDQFRWSTHVELVAEFSFKTQ